MKSFSRQEQNANSRSIIHIYSDPRALLALLAFCEHNIVRYFILAFSMIPFIGEIGPFIVPFVYCILLALYIRKYGASLSLIEAFVFAFAFLSVFLSCLIYPENSKYILASDNLWYIIFPCFKFFLLGLIIIPDKKTLDLLGKASCLAVIVESLFVVFYMIPRGLVNSDDMSRSYQLLPNILLTLNYTFNHKRILSVLCSILGVFYCVSMGTRGPIIIGLAFIFIKIIQSSSMKIRNKIIFGVVLLATGILFLNSDLYVVVLEFVRARLESLGLSTRVVDLAIEGNITEHLSGRDEIYELIWSKIKARPLRGYGVYGEWQWIQWNAHSMYLELFVHFGIPLGSLIVLWIIWQSGTCYFKAPSKSTKDMVLIWFVFVFIKSIFGGSWLNYGVFFLIGLCLREKRRIRSHYYFSIEQNRLTVEIRKGVADVETGDSSGRI